MKTQLFESTSTVQVNDTNVFATIPGSVRSVLKPKKGDKVEWIVFNDGSVEVKIIRKEE
jgi:bifunctional DNA-binding transcriptional regulator/antitoxin component of YhaV-PrlF toxin-antitoxin module